MEFKTNKPQRIEELTQHATPLSVEEYQGSDISIAEKNYDIPTSVSQGDGKLVTAGKLYSEGFSQCSAFIIENPETKQGGFFHVADIDFQLEHQKLLKEFFLNWLETKNLDPIEKKNLSEAIIDICFYRYPKTMKREAIAPKLKALGIESVRTKLFCGNSGRYSIDSRLRESLLEFLGVALPETYIFDNNRKHWSALINFENGSVEIGLKSDNKVLHYAI